VITLFHTTPDTDILLEVSAIALRPEVRLVVWTIPPEAIHHEPVNVFMSVEDTERLIAALTTHLSEVRQSHAVEA
jgi:hypothetical protein